MPLGSSLLSAVEVLSTGVHRWMSLLSIVLTYWTLNILLLLWKAPCHWWGEQAHQYTHPEFSDQMGAWSYQHSWRETAHERLVICHLATHTHHCCPLLTHTPLNQLLCVLTAVKDMGQCIQYVLSVHQQDRAIDAFRLIKIAVHVLPLKIERDERLLTCIVTLCRE